jgi:hypothetical protein
MMEKQAFKALPIGSVVSHSNTDTMCFYRRVEGGTGWLVVERQEPYKAQFDGEVGIGRASLPPRAAKDVTLVRYGVDGNEPPPVVKKKSVIIAEQADEIEDLKEEIEKLGACLDSQAEVLEAQRRRTQYAEEVLRGERERNAKLREACNEYVERIGHLGVERDRALQRNRELIAELDDYEGRIFAANKALEGK